MTAGQAGQGFRVDLHVHTTAGSADSAIKAAALPACARAAGLAATAVTEHFRVWDAFEAQQIAAESGLTVLRGVEWNTDAGHVLVFGVERYDSSIRRASALRDHVLAAGGFMILAHPFRHFFDPPQARRWLAGDGPATMSADKCAGLPIFGLVDEIEVQNGNCTPRENAFSAEVAAVRGMRGTGGSDAHYGEDVGRCHTLFERPLACVEELLQELRAGRFVAVGPPVC